jgi:RHS repeat-associated protein
MTKRGVNEAALVSLTFADRPTASPGTTNEVAQFSAPAADLVAWIGALRLTTDATPPTIAGVAASSTQPTSATDTFTTSEPSVATVDYGATSALGTTSAPDTLRTTHSFTLTSLMCGTTYSFRVRAADTAGNRAVSSIATFTATACHGHTPTFVDERHGTMTLTGPLTIPVPPGTRRGDLILVGSSVLASTPLGYQKVGDFGSPTATQTVLRRFADGSETSVTLTGVTGNAATSAVVVVYRGVDQITFATASNPASNSANTTVTANSITPGTPNSQLVYLTHESNALQAGTWSASGMTRRSGAETSASASAFAADQVWAPTTGTGPRTATFTQTAPQLAGWLAALNSTTDATAPAITAATVTPAAAAASVSWTTSEYSSTFLDFGTTAMYGTSIGTLSLVTSHSVALADLVCSTTYHYRMRSVDAAGNQAATGDATFRTANCATGTTTVQYTRDALDRVVARAVNGTTIARYSYISAGDSPSLVVDNAGAVIERTIGLFGGATITKRSTGDVWSYSNIHGDIVATANSSGVKQGATRAYDPYGQAISGEVPDNSSGNYDYGWLGQHERGLEHQGALSTIEMGARQYVPSLGRFLEADPVPGGCANDYAYVSGDPVNSSDLTGELQSCKAASWVGDGGTFTLRWMPDIARYEWGFDINPDWEEESGATYADYQLTRWHQPYGSTQWRKDGSDSKWSDVWSGYGPVYSPHYHFHGRFDARYGKNGSISFRNGEVLHFDLLQTLYNNHRQVVGYTEGHMRCQI